MSRKVRTTKKIFKVFCEGNTEYQYIDELRRQKKLSIVLKPVNMKGGGYSRFLEQVQIDGTANCLAKFIIIDGDRAAADHGEAKQLAELIKYCSLQNENGKTPHFLIVSHPDFEYIACLHTPGYTGQNVKQYITKELGYRSLDEFKADTRIYHALNTAPNSVHHMLASLKKENCLILNPYSVNQKQYEITVSTVYRPENSGKNASNIHEFFEVIHCFEGNIL